MHVAQQGDATVMVIICCGQEPICCIGQSVRQTFGQKLLRSNHVLLQSLKTGELFNVFDRRQPPQRRFGPSVSSMLSSGLLSSTWSSARAGAGVSGSPSSKRTVISKSAADEDSSRLT
eukprot:3281139-Amphidinium_carterae.1